MIVIAGNRTISEVLACLAVNRGDPGNARVGWQDKSSDCRRAHVVGGIGVYRVQQTQHASASGTKINHSNAKRAVAAVDSHWSYP
jgi:hypothetical protein